MRQAPWTLEQHLAKGLERAIEVGECLEWQGGFSCYGVTPVVRVRDGKKYGRNVPVCPQLWIAANGPVPDGMVVYRTCNNNNCVCLDHLAVGTRKQWMAHRAKHGLTKHSEKTRLKLTVVARARPACLNTLEKAREVRALSGEMLNKDIAKVTGVSEEMVSRICLGKSWKDVLNNPFSGLMA